MPEISKTLDTIENGIEIDDLELETSLITFASETLGHDLYQWQCDVLEPFDHLSEEMIQVSLSTPNGSGKAQPREEPVWTPIGWVPIGELKPGHEVFSADGTVTRVASVHPQGTKPVARVSFDDGSWTRCCMDHLWQVQSACQRNDDKTSTPGKTPGRWLGHTRWSVLPLSEVANRKRLHRYIPLAEPHAAGQHREFEIDPYTLGVLLGDGCLQSGSTGLCTRHDTLANCAWPHGVELRLSDARGVVSNWSIIDARKIGRETLWMQAMRRLGIAGKHSWEKFIPREYFLGSQEQRLELLRGLMDTDGTMGKNPKSSPEFNTTSRLLADGVIELVQSLGGIATMTTRIPHFTHKGVRKAGRMDHRIRPVLKINPFRVERKARLWSAGKTYGPRRIMETITPDGQADCVCITVEHPSGLYITRGHIVTHNSSVIISSLVLGLLTLYPKAKIILTTADGRQIDSQVMPAIEAHRGKFPDWKFIYREVHTPTGGMFVAFTTDDAGRAEGWHKIDDIEGPCIIIVDEAKTVDEKIFSAFDRCTYNAILITSSPGKMSGTFYESQHKPELGYIKIAIGLKDCPHITQDKVDRILAKWGPNHPFTRSSLHGEFIEIFEGEAVHHSYSMEWHETIDLPWPKGAYLVRGWDFGTSNGVVWSAYWESAGIEYWWDLCEQYYTGSDTDRQVKNAILRTDNEFPFHNDREQCAGVLDYIDPAGANSSYTKQIKVTMNGRDTTVAESSANILRTYRIYPGMRTVARGLQETIAVVNRLFEKRDPQGRWCYQIDVNGCPRLARAYRGGYRYPAVGESGYGNDAPMKGAACDNLDHLADAARYGKINCLRLLQAEMAGTKPPLFAAKKKSANPVRRL